MSSIMEKLIEVIEDEDIEALKKLHQEGADLKQPIDAGLEYGLEDPDYMPVLFFAIRKQASIAFIETLLELGLSLDLIDDDGLSIIDIAIKFKRVDILNYCIDKGIDLNETHRPSKITPIILASCFNNIEIAQFLLDNGANINSQDSNGMSAKDYAKKLGQKKMLSFLEENGAKYNRYGDVVARKDTLQEKQGDMKNRQAPTDDMGFDSI